MVSAGLFGKDYSTDGLFPLRYNCGIVSLRGGHLPPARLEDCRLH